ncbi:MAG TPA: uroporphyrinogen decarboxylase family protein [bacterium]|nr:uroporphyrinogen decarboxylase family protein [bacterium]HPG44696.1 uroporphyrinogen decarboxylase family protein [bacterium]HPM99397.1 uroporphyrinogen decarboxylase family protein [bacterium]
MPGRQRLQDALNHRQPDAIPVDLGASSVTGIHVSCVAGLRDYYKLEKRLVKVHEPYQMLGLVEDDLLDALGVDVVGLGAPENIFGFANENWRPYTLDSGLQVLVSEHMQTTRDQNGDTLIYPKGDLTAMPSGRMPQNGYFFDTIVRQHPIDETHLNPADNLEEFTLVGEKELSYYAREIANLRDNPRGVLASFGGTALGDIALVPAPFLKDPKGIRDIEEWYVSTVIRQDFIRQIFQQQTDIALQNLAKLWETVGDRVDALFICGTDFGTQNSTFCSEETYRELYMPYYRRINDWIHAHTTWKTFKHSCGAVAPLIDAMIESGFDILNPVQLTARGMDARKLKAEYGDRLVFWGGGIDTQSTLPFGRPDEVRRQVLERCEILGRDGGFVFNAVHNIQANTPIKNIVAMFDAVREFNGRR